jgi:hypothetical protein
MKQKHKKPTGEIKVDHEPSLKGSEICSIMNWTPSFLRRARDLYGLKFIRLSGRTFRYKLSWAQDFEAERTKAAG